MYIYAKEKRIEKKNISTVKDVAINCSQVGQRHINFQDACCGFLRKG